MTGQLGIVYLLHFDRAYQHARHYTGDRRRRARPGWNGTPPAAVPG